MMPWHQGKLPLGGKSLSEATMVHFTDAYICAIRPRRVKDEILALLYIMANCWIGDKPLSVLINPIRTRRVAILVLARGACGILCAFRAPFY